MPTEIERKFLVTGTEWRQVNCVRYSQGYLCRDKERTVRVRLAGGQAFLTIKGSSKGASRAEFEYKIPVVDAEQLMNLCDGSIIQKLRHILFYKGFKWEIDEFLGENSGLIIAEVELEKEDQRFDRPGWLGREVTEDPRYYNSNLSSNPYYTWRDLPGK
jgi:adenylate cyclase